MPEKWLCKAERKYDWNNTSLISVHTSQEAIHVWRREAYVSRHSPSIYIPSVSCEIHMACVVPWAVLSQWNKRETTTLPVEAAHQAISDGRERKNVASPPRASGRSTASMPGRVLNERAHLTVASEGKNLNQWVLLMNTPWQKAAGKVESAASAWSLPYKSLPILNVSLSLNAQALSFHPVHDSILF